MLFSILWLIVGFVLVVKGGDLFVDSSIHIAERLRIPRVVIGGTLVSLATTAPELVVSSTASLMGDSGIAIGNAVGSAIANIGLGIGVVAMIVTIHVDKKDFQGRSLWMVIAAILMIVFSWSRHLNRTFGLILFLLSLLYLGADYFIHVRGKKKIKSDESFGHLPPLMKTILTFVSGAILVVLGSRLLVTSGVKIAEILNIPSAIIGLSVIAVGTSLPELVTAISSARKGVPDLSVGNIIGANVLNLSMITGASALIHPLTITSFTQIYSFSWLIVFIIALIFVLGKTGEVVRREGYLFLSLYAVYIMGLIFLPASGLMDKWF